MPPEFLLNIGILALWLLSLIITFLYARSRNKNEHEQSVSNDHKNQPQSVAKYYDDWTQRYLDTYGEIIQAYRPSNTDELLRYTIQSIGLQDGQRILDAGCGVCGPAVFFAKHLDLQIEAVTISPKQVEIGKTKIQEATVENKVQVRQGDYHELSNIYEGQEFDGILFLESLGHAANPQKVIQEAYKLTKRGGFIYIKDFFPKEEAHPVLAQQIGKVIDRINDAYTYNVLDLYETLSALRSVGFEIIYIKRPGYENDIYIRADFEKKNGIELYGGKAEFVPAEWLEIKCQKIIYECNEVVKEGTW